MKISVILPTYNEKANILPLVEAIHNELFDYDHEVLVIDDNSPDGTFQTLKNAALPYVRPILRTENRGFANSIRCGLENASGDIMIVMDSDFNHQPRYLPFMVKAIFYYDCVTASRFLYGGLMKPRSRHLLSWVFNVFVRIVTRGLITDNLYGYFAIKKACLEKLNFDDIFWGYGDYCIRLMYYLEKSKAEILQFPAVNGERRGGKGNSAFLKVFLQYTKETLKLVLK